MRRSSIIALVAIACHTGCASPKGRGALYATGTATMFVGAAFMAHTFATYDCNEPETGDVFDGVGCAAALIGPATLELMVIALGAAIVGGTKLLSPSDPSPAPRVARVRHLSNN